MLPLWDAGGNVGLSSTSGYGSGSGSGSRSDEESNAALGALVTLAPLLLKGRTRSIDVLADKELWEQLRDGLVSHISV
jgi:hypothetical protein